MTPNETLAARLEGDPKLQESGALLTPVLTRPEMWSIIAALRTVPEDGFALRWRDTKVTVPCDGDQVLGLWGKTYRVISYINKDWIGGRDGAYDPPRFWMPLPPVPQE